MQPDRLDNRFLDEFSLTTKQAEVYERDFSAPGSFGVRFGKGGKKAFFYVYKIAGKRKRITLGHYPLIDVEQARAKAMELAERIADGADPAAEESVFGSSSMSFADLARRFLFEAQLSQKTLSEYQRIVDRELLPLFADRLPQTISNSELIRLRDQLANVRSREVMAKRVVMLASRVFNFGIKIGVLTDNPAKGVEVHHEHTPREYAMSFDELHQLWRVLADEDLLIQTAFRVMILTAQRPGVVLKMRWSDLNFDCWNIPDSKSNQSIYLCDQAVDAIKRLRPINGSKDYVFSNRKDQPLRYLTRASKRLNDRLSLASPFTPSDLRRTFDVRAREVGIRVDVIAKILGQQTALERLKVREIDYFPEIQQALRRWAKVVVPPTPMPKKPVGDSKVIPLFGE